MRPSIDSNDDYVPMESLCAVHVTAFMPARDDAGNLLICPRYQAPGAKTYRDTVHFALNHHVSSHSWGSWDKSAYVVLASLKELRENNPHAELRSLYDVDTYFAVGPEGPLKVTNYHFIQPHQKHREELFHTEGNITTYKNHGFRLKDLVDLRVEHRSTYNSIIEDWREKLLPGTVQELDTKLYEFEDKRWLSSLHPNQNQAKPANIWGSEYEKLSDWLKDKGSKADDIATATHICVSRIKLCATKMAMKNLGFEYRQGGAQYWLDQSHDVSSRLTNTAKLQGIPNGRNLHQNTPDHGFESAITDLVHQIKTKDPFKKLLLDRTHSEKSNRIADHVYECGFEDRYVRHPDGYDVCVAPGWAAFYVGELLSKPDISSAQKRAATHVLTRLGAEINQDLGGKYTVSMRGIEVKAQTPSRNEKSVTPKHADLASDI